LSEPKKALIVEKNSKEAESLVHFLEKLGFVVLVETNAVRVLAIIDKHKFDFAFIECDLEGIPGPDLAYQLKIKDRTMHISLMISRRYEPEWVMKALRKARLTQHFVKPIDGKEILAYFAALKVTFEKIVAAKPKVEEENLRTSKLVQTFTRVELAAKIEFFKIHLKGRNHFELLGIDKTYSPKEIKKAYRELSKIFHPDLLESWLSPPLLAIARDFFTNMTTAYAVLSDPKKRFTYEHELEHGTAASLISAEAIMDHGISYLRQSNFPAALEKFEAAALEGVMNDELKLLILWAQMEMIGMDLAPGDTKKMIFDALTQLRMKKCDTAEYHYCWGLYYYISDDKDAALRSFQNAVMRKTNFVEAQRKIQIIIVSRPIHDPNKPQQRYGSLGVFGGKGKKTG
jgi:curved DNA-binding protein CbpA/DNA-binding response OmpR family regulator